MFVANLELSQELFELSGWDDTDLEWSNVGQCRLYDLGYLLRKLPQNTYVKQLEKTIYEAADYDFDTRQPTIITQKTTPEDALCDLAIELFKQGILTKDTGEA